MVGSQKIPFKRAATTVLVASQGKRMRRSSSIGVETATKSAAKTAVKRVPLRLVQYKRVHEQPIPLQLLTTTGSPSLVPIGFIPEGTADNQRDGGVIRYEYMEWKCTLSRLAASSTGTARLIIFRWKQGLAVPVPGDILIDVPGTSNVHGTYNVQYSAKYKILHDKIYNLNEVAYNSGSSNYAVCNKTFGGTIKLGYNVQYDDNTGSSYDDAIYCWLMADFSTDMQGFLQTALTYTEV